MKFKSTIVKVEFYVDEEYRTVECHIIYKTKVPKNVMLNDFDMYNFIQDSCAIGVAKCHPDDTFDVTIGKRIAESRAKRIIYSKNYELLNYICNKYKRTFLSLKTLMDDINQYKYLLSNEKEHIKYLIDNNN